MTENRLKFIGASVIFRYMGELDLGVVNRVNGNDYGVISCTTQNMRVITEQPLLLSTINKLYDYLRGKELLDKDLNDHIELIKYRHAYAALRNLMGAISDIIDNTNEESNHTEAILMITNQLTASFESGHCYVDDKHPF